MTTYLVALDTSPVAVDVLAAAQQLAASTQARLLLCRAVGLPTDLPPESYATSPAGVVNMLFTTARKNLTTKAEELPSELKAESIVEIGPAWRVICEVAKARDVDLIIIGAHGHRILDRVLGTTTQQVVAHADRSVLVVRQNPRMAELHPVEALRAP
jgi:nucleotide-binding universal stress UspA family protein